MKIFTATALAVLLAMPAMAQQRCGNANDIKKKLAGLGELRVLTGKESRGGHVEIYLHPETRKWTAITVLPNGMACLSAHGDDMRFGGEITPEGDPA